MKKYSLIGSIFGACLTLQSAESTLTALQTPYLVTATKDKVALSLAFISRSRVLFDLISISTPDTQEVGLELPFTYDVATVHKFVQLVEAPSDDAMERTASLSSKEGAGAVALYDFFDIQCPALCMVLEGRLKKTIEDKSYILRSLPPYLEQQYLANFFNIKHILLSTKPISTVAMAADSHRAIAGTRVNYAEESGKVKIIDVATGKKLSTVKFDDIIKSVAISADGHRAIVSFGICGDRSAKIMNVDTGQISHTIPFKDPATSVAISADGRRVIAGLWDNDNAVKVIDIPDRQVLALHSRRPIESVAIAADGSKVIVGAGNCATTIDVYSGAILNTIFFKGRVSSVAISADGSRAIAGSWDHTARVFDVATGQIKLFRKFTNWINDVGISGDGTTAIIGSSDKTAEIIDVTAGKIKYTFLFNNRVNSVGISADGSSAIAGGEDGLIQLIILGKHFGLAQLQDLYEQYARVVKSGYTPLDKLKDTLAQWVSRRSNKIEPTDL